MGYKTIELGNGDSLCVSVPYGFSLCQNRIPIHDCLCLTSVYTKETRYIAKTMEKCGGDTSAITQCIHYFTNGRFEPPCYNDYLDLSTMCGSPSIHYPFEDNFELFNEDIAEAVMERMSPYSWHYQGYSSGYYKKDENKYIDEFYMEVIGYHVLPDEEGITLNQNA